MARTDYTTSMCWEPTYDRVTACLEKQGFHLTHQVPMPFAKINTVPERPKPKPSHWLRNTLLGGTALVGGGLAADHFLNQGSGLNAIKQYLFQQFPNLKPESARKSELMAELSTDLNSAHDQAYGALDRLPANYMDQAVNQLGKPSFAASTLALPASLMATKFKPSLLPTIGKVQGPLNGITGALSGYALGTNPAVVDGWSAPTNDKWNPAHWFNPNGSNPETTRKVLGATGAATLGAVGALGKGRMALPALVADLGSNVAANSLEGSVRNLSQESQFHSNLADSLRYHLTNTYHGELDSARKLHTLKTMFSGAGNPLKPRFNVMQPMKRLFGFDSTSAPGPGFKNKFYTNPAEQFPVTSGLLNRIP